MPTPVPRLIKKFKVADLVPAEWNPKGEGTDDEIKTLMNSIEADGSCGVPAVRVNEAGDTEVIDGNHRLSALQRLGWASVPVEHFGEISKAKAALIGHRRNHDWFAESELEFARLLKGVVLEEMSVEDIVDFMPESEKELNDLLASLEFDWGEFDKDNEPPEPLAGHKVYVTLDDEAYCQWEAWRDRVELATSDDTAEEAFRLLLYYTLEQKIG